MSLPLPQLWTVIGLHQNTMRVMTARISAEDVYRAMQLVARKFHNLDFVILGAIPGDHKIIPALEKGTAAYRGDLV